MNRRLCDIFVAVHDARHWTLAFERAKRRGVLIPERPPCVAVSLAWGRHWVASVGVLENGPLLMFEYLVLNDELPAVWRHAALERLMRDGKAYAAAVGKRPVMVVDRRRGGVGIRKMAERLGFASRNENLEVLEGK